PRFARGGFTLIEVMIAMIVLLIALMALTSTSLVVHSVNESDRLRRKALSGLRTAVERRQSRSTALIDSDTGWANDLVLAYGGGGNPGPLFSVRGLDPWEGEASLGTIQIITDETDTDGILGVNLGMPKDLNADGDTLSTDVTADAQLLPVIVRVRWEGAAGQREFTQGFWIARM
ncbi:MAG: prepilin-type N-terminal cleavage/methylation domain-containing protein, partial [Planctomycetota bacterium]